MLAMNDGEMAVHNRKWIAVQNKITKRDPFFLRILVLRAKETRTLQDRCAIYSGRGAFHPPHSASREKHHGRCRSRIYPEASVFPFPSKPGSGGKRDRVW